MADQRAPEPVALESEKILPEDGDPVVIFWQALADAKRQREERNTRALAPWCYGGVLIY